MLNYKFRLYPNKETEEKLEYNLELCRQTYNNLLAELQKQKNKKEVKIMEQDRKVFKLQVYIYKL